MSIDHKKTVETEVKCVEINTREKLPNSHGLMSLTVTSPRKFLQPSPEKSVKRSNQGSTTGETPQKAHGCKSISCVNPEKFNFRKTRANEMGFRKELSIGMCMEKELATQHSKQLLNAVGIFNSNKELFISLLENPNSLLVNQIENFQDSRAKRKKTKHFHAGKLAEFHAKEREASSAKPRDRSSSVEEDDPQLLRNLVVLKPSPLTRQDSVQRLGLCSFLHYHSMFVRKRQRSRRPYFSFGNLKRKIMHVLKLGGKEPKKSPHFFHYAEGYGKEVLMEALRRTSSSRSYLDNGSRSDGKNRDKTTHNNGASITQSYESSKIYGDDILPVSIKASAEMELHRLGNEGRVCESPPCEENKKKTNDHFQTRCTKSNFAEDLSRETHFEGDEFTPNGSEIICSVKMTNSLLFPVDNSIKINLSQRIDTSNINGEDGNLDSNRLDSFLSVQSPNTLSSSKQRMENAYGMMDGEIWPSQEQFSSDAPAREAFKFDELPVHALKVDMEVHSSSPKILTRELQGNFTSLDRYSTISECIKALLLASRFRCKELVVKCRLFDRMNVLTLLDQLKLLHNQLCGDCRLVADYIIEILEDLHQCHKEQCIKSLDVKKVMFHEVMKRVNCQFTQQPLPTTWENIAKENIMRSRTWRDSPDDAEAIVVEATKCVLEELIMESTIDIGSFPRVRSSYFPTDSELVHNQTCRLHRMIDEQL